MISNADEIEGFVICPVVYCGMCFSPMDITHWLVLDNLIYPDCNAGHECKGCGKYWMPSSGQHGHLIMTGNNSVQFFHDCGNDSLD